MKNALMRTETVPMGVIHPVLNRCLYLVTKQVSQSDSHKLIQLAEKKKMSNSNHNHRKRAPYIAFRLLISCTEYVWKITQRRRPRGGAGRKSRRLPLHSAAPAIFFTCI
jgi:hypothetical protein